MSWSRDDDDVVEAVLSQSYSMSWMPQPPPPPEAARARAMADSTVVVAVVVPGPKECVNLGRVFSKREVSRIMLGWNGDSSQPMIVQK